MLDPNIQIGPVPEGDIEALSRFADRIWRAHFHGIVSDGQIDYMLARFQSPGAIAEDIRDGCGYYTAVLDGEIVGYGAARPEGERLFLSKLYTDAPLRGRGLGWAILTRLIRDLGWGCREVYLHVNRGNRDSIAAYRRMGFAVGPEIDGDIGGGYTTEDYEMILPLEG